VTHFAVAFIANDATTSLAANWFYVFEIKIDPNEFKFPMAGEKFFFSGSERFVRALWAWPCLSPRTIAPAVLRSN
jgi:hypothetical protein